MTDLTDFASLSLAELTVELESMLDKAHTKTRERAERFSASRFTPAVTGSIFPVGTSQELNA